MSERDARDVLMLRDQVKDLETDRDELMVEVNRLQKVIWDAARDLLRGFNRRLDTLVNLEEQERKLRLRIAEAGDRRDSYAVDRLDEELDRVKEKIRLWRASTKS